MPLSSLPTTRSGLFALLVVVAVLGACAPFRMPAGPGPTEPRLAAARLVAADGTELPLRAWLPRDTTPGAAEGESGAAPRAVLLALHGFNDYSNAFQEPGRWLAARGIAVYAYDQRGFGAAPHRGLWAGSKTLVDDARLALALLRARHPGVPLYLLGESMGGAVAILAATRPPLPRLAGLILSAPAIWARSEMPIYQRAALWLAARLIPGARLTGQGLGVQASDNLEMLRALGGDPLVIKATRIDAIDGLTNLMSEALAAAPRLAQPALLLYGQKDEIVPKDPTFAFWRRLPHEARDRQRTAYYEQGWHMLLRDLQAPVVYADIAHWIADRDRALPSGADIHAVAALARSEQRDGEPTTDEMAAGSAGDWTKDGSMDWSLGWNVRGGAGLAE